MTQVSDTYVDGLVQERRNSIANALELHFSYTFCRRLALISSES